MTPTVTPDGSRPIAGGVLRPLWWAWDRLPQLMLAGCGVGGCVLVGLCGYGLARTSPEPPRKQAPVFSVADMQCFQSLCVEVKEKRWELFEARCEQARLAEENAKLRARLGEGDRIPAQNLPVVPADGPLPPPAEFGIQLEERP